MKESTDEIAGYARILIGIRIKQLQTKPFFGKPYLKLAQCYPLWGYFFQLGGLLGAKHLSKPKALLHALFGVRESAVEVLTETADRLVPDAVDETMAFSDYVLNRLMQNTGTTDSASFMLKAGASRLSSESAASAAWSDALDGAAIGATHPQLVRQMYARQHTQCSKEDWDRAHAAGLDIPAEQDVLTYEELEEGENEAFMQYCQECCPDLHAILKE